LTKKGKLGTVEDEDGGMMDMGSDLEKANTKKKPGKKGSQ
jgi:hypothetical protein